MFDLANNPKRCGTQKEERKIINFFLRKDPFKIWSICHKFNS